MTGRKYATSAGFRKALEERLKNISRKEGVDIMRLRRQVAFDRLLARLFHRTDSPWLLKGGYAMELRVKKARTTKDLDLSLETKPEKDLLDLLQETGSLDLGDFFVFMIGESIMDLDAAPYGGQRHPVEVRMDGRVFVRFHLDVGIGDERMEPFENLKGREWLDFAGLISPRVTATSREQQFAEKLHAYTMPRVSPNSRVKDIVDMLLLIDSGKLDTERVKRAVEKTFLRRKTHPIPALLAPPPREWERPFRELADECELKMGVSQAFATLSGFFMNVMRA